MIDAIAELKKLLYFCFYSMNHEVGDLTYFNYISWYIAHNKLPLLLAYDDVTFRELNNRYTWKKKRKKYSINWITEEINYSSKQSKEMEWIKSIWQALFPYRFFFFHQFIQRCYWSRIRCSVKWLLMLIFYRIFLSTLW